MEPVTARYSWLTHRVALAGLLVLPWLVANPAALAQAGAGSKSGSSAAFNGAATATLLCEAFYLPARTPWVRRVEIGYDQQRVRSVHIDGVPVYTFSIRGTVILTALDNERIQIDTATRTWTSDFRGLATAQGRCELDTPAQTKKSPAT